MYAYYPGVDTIAHEFGLHDRVFARELAFVDRFVGELLDALPRDAALLVTSDHGQVHLEAESWIEIPELLPLATAIAGDGRFRYLYANAEHAQGAARPGARARAPTGRGCGRAPSCSRSGMFGAGATGTVPGRIGSVVLAAREPVAFVDPALPNERTLRSGHGSLTPDEMYVPLLAARGARLSPTSSPPALGVLRTSQRPEHERDLQRQPTVGRGLLAGRAGPPVDRHLHVGGEHRDEQRRGGEPADPPGRRAGPRRPRSASSATPLT